MFDAGAPTPEDDRNRVEYLQKEMNKVNLSPINKFELDRVQIHEQAEGQGAEKECATFENEDHSRSVIDQSSKNNPIVDSSASISRQKVGKRVASMDSQRDKKKDQMKLNEPLPIAGNTSRDRADASNNYEAEVLVSKIDMEEPRILAQMDESCLAPSEMTTSTQRVRLRHENQALKE